MKLPERPRRSATYTPTRINTLPAGTCVTGHAHELQAFNRPATGQAAHARHHTYALQVRSLLYMGSV
jgi:hypothetical protein